ncbi:hypothetical protein ACFQS2_01610 [Brachybacterium sp. GCM10030267]|uniref:hypothetical protein n=1 Tax=unclassified Brachybacterium TaxID=2623841 RepID=UPI00361A7EF2
MKRVSLALRSLEYGIQHDIAHLLLIALPLGALLLVIPAKSRRRVAVFAGLGVLLGLGTIVLDRSLWWAPSLWGTSGQGLSPFDVLRPGLHAVILAGALCAVVVVVRSWQGREAAGRVLAPSAGLLLGLGAPYDFRTTGEQIFYPVFSRMYTPEQLEAAPIRITLSSVADDAFHVAVWTLATTVVVLVLVVFGRRSGAVAVGAALGAVVSAVLAGGELVVDILVRALALMGRPGVWFHVPSDQIITACVAAIVLGIVAALLSSRVPRPRIR